MKGYICGLKIHIKRERIILNRYYTEKKDRIQRYLKKNIS